MQSREWKITTNYYPNELIELELVKKFQADYITRKLIIIFTRARHWYPY
jgi:hypothetical protein